MEQNIKKEIKFLTEQIAKDKNSILFARLADMRRLNEELEKAIELCELGLKRYPFYITAHIIMAKCYRDAQLNDQAKEELFRVLAFDQYNVAANKILSELFQEEGDAKSAEEHLKTIILADPLNSESETIIPALGVSPAPPRVVEKEEAFAELPEAEAGHPEEELEGLDTSFGEAGIYKEEVEVPEIEPVWPEETEISAEGEKALLEGEAKKLPEEILAESDFEISKMETISPEQAVKQEFTEEEEAIESELVPEELTLEGEEVFSIPEEVSEEEVSTAEGAGEFILPEEAEKIEEPESIPSVSEESIPETSESDITIELESSELESLSEEKKEEAGKPAKPVSAPAEEIETIELEEAFEIPEIEKEEHIEEELAVGEEAETITPEEEAIITEELSVSPEESVEESETETAEPFVGEEELTFVSEDEYKNGAGKKAEDTFEQPATEEESKETVYFDEYIQSDKNLDITYDEDESEELEEPVIESLDLEKDFEIDESLELEEKTVPKETEIKLEKTEVTLEKKEEDLEDFDFKIEPEKELEADIEDELAEEGTFEEPEESEIKSKFESKEEKPIEMKVSPKSKVEYDDTIPLIEPEEKETEKETVDYDEFMKTDFIEDFDEDKTDIKIKKKSGEELLEDFETDFESKPEEDSTEETADTLAGLSEEDLNILEPTDLSDEEGFTGEIATLTLAEIYSSQGRYEKALRVLNLLFEKNPENPKYLTKIQEIKNKMNG